MINSATASSMTSDPALVEEVRVLSKISNLRAAWGIARQWLVISAVLVAACWIDHWLAYVVCVIVIATRQHALVVLMHDATHYRLFSNRIANDLVSDLFCAYPVAISTLGYRLEHLPHHSGPNTDDDPYFGMFKKDGVWHWPKTRWQALRIVLADIFIWHIPKNLKMASKWAPLGMWWHYRNDKRVFKKCCWDGVRFVIYLTAVNVIPALFGVWHLFMLLWVLPALTFFFLLVRMRWISEHPFRPGTDQVRDTRHVDGTLLERLSVAPLNINYHIAHHLFTSVPFYNLPTLHKKLLEIEEYKTTAKCYATYFGSSGSVFGELLDTSASVKAEPVQP